MINQQLFVIAHITKYLIRKIRKIVNNHTLVFVLFSICIIIDSFQTDSKQIQIIIMIRNYLSFQEKYTFLYNL